MSSSEKFTFHFADAFKRAYKKLPHPIQEKTKKTMAFMAEDPFHPSLRSKKNAQASKRFGEKVFESSINMQYRILWKYEGSSVIVLLLVGDHDIVTDKKHR